MESWSISHSYQLVKGPCGCECMEVGFKTTYAITESVPITTDVVGSNPDQGEVYNII